MKLKYKIALGIIGILLIGSISIGVSYSLWVQTFEGSQTNIIQSGCFKIEFEELSDSINLTNTYPMSDKSALSKIKPYQVKLTNTCGTTDAGYAITLNTVGTETKVKLDDTKVKFAVGENGETITSGLLLSEAEVNTELENITGQITGDLITSYIIKNGFIEKGASKTFDIYLWVDEAAGNEVMNQVFNAAVAITSYSAKIPNMLEDYGIDDSVVTDGEGIYKVEHPDSEFTESFSSNLTADQINNLKKTEYRYAGNNPNNYVTFNDEFAGWRIIGLVNTPEGQRLKLVRNESIGQFSWDSSSEDINSGYGINEWSQADIMTLLNSGAYYNRTSGACYTDRNNVSTDCDFTNIGLTSISKNMIDTVTWNTGTNGNNAYNLITTRNLYNYERSNNNGKICENGEFCTDNVSRTTSWKGQIGLIYPSDYGYATSGNEINRNTCQNKELYDWNNTEEIDCKSNNWLASQMNYWTMTALSYNNTANNVYRISEDGIVQDVRASISNEIRPSIYLQTNIKILSGKGTPEEPYTLY